MNDHALSLARRIAHAETARRNREDIESTTLAFVGERGRYALRPPDARLEAFRNATMEAMEAAFRGDYSLSAHWPDEHD